jgi:hypothetical protein
MNAKSLSKAERRELRQLVELAHDRELSSAAADLMARFADWRAGKMNVFELNEQIHRYHDGPSRDLYKTYVIGKARWSVASAIARGVLKESEVSPVILESLRGATELFREMEAEGDGA